MNAKINTLILAMVISSLFGLQAVAQVSASTGANTVITNGKSTIRYSTSNGLNDFNIEMRGRIELTDDDRDIKSMSDDGYLEINKTVFGSRRTVVIESLGGGKLKREYYEGRTKKEWQPDGKAWLNEILPDIIRNTTIGAESRVARFFKAGGTTAVLEEIEKIDSDHAAAHYANLLMKQPVPVKEYQNIVSTLAKQLDSDHYLSELLKNNVGKFMQSGEASTAFFNATKNLESDHYKTVVIKEALRNQLASSDNVRTILQAAGKMESDHYITDVLTTLLSQNNLSEPILAELITTTNRIESDHYKTVVLKKALDKPGLGASSYQKVVESVKDIESDHYLTDVVRHLLRSKLSDDVLVLVLDLTGSIESDHYKSEVLRVIINRQDIKDHQFARLVEACAEIESDHYKSEIFKEMLRSPGISDGKVLAILNQAKNIDSDHYASEVLLNAAPRVRGGNQSLKDAYRQAAKSIDSETFYGKALRAID
jgi:SOS response regulatory protein OraA/RecX